MKRIQKILLAFMLGMLPIQAVWADRNVDLLVDLAEKGDLAKIKQLVEQQGVDVNAMQTTKLDFGEGTIILRQTALYAASNFGHLDVVKYLISKGADVNMKNDDRIGGTALNIASYKGYLEIVKYLVEKGADVNMKNGRFGNTALIGVSNLEVVKYLISKGADVNAKNNDGSTALMIASREGHLEVVKVLVESSKGGLFSFFKKGNINDKDNDGWTALIWASSKGHLEVVKYLVSKGADINATDNKGFTALNKAKTNEVSEFLKSKGAKRMQIQFEYK